jgi:hypothetical protein
VGRNKNVCCYNIPPTHILPLVFPFPPPPVKSYSKLSFFNHHVIVSHYFHTRLVCVSFHFFIKFIYSTISTTSHYTHTTTIRRKQQTNTKNYGYMPTPYPGIRSILAKSHSLLQSGHTLRVFNHRWIQSKWNTCPHVPKVILRPLSFVGDGLA